MWDGRRATGVSFQTSTGGRGGKLYKAWAKKEVILAAGAISTPAVLQRSGVGERAHLDRLKIPVIIDLPTVGKNLQEQTMSVLGAHGKELGKEGEGPSDVIAFPNLFELFGHQEAEKVVTYMWNNLDAWADSQKGHALSKEALKTVYELQWDFIVSKRGAA